MSLDELTGGRVRLLVNSRTRLFAFGGVGTGDSPFSERFARQLGALRPLESSFLFGRECYADNILDRLDSLAMASGSGDTAVIYYFGHGMPDYFVVPASGARLYKNIFSHYASGIAGRKIIIASACHADFSAIPENTLLVASSAIDTVSMWGALEMALSYDLAYNVAGSRRPLDTFVACLLQQYHNRPLISLQADKMDPGALRGPYSTYQEEKFHGRPMLSGDYQRVKVRSTLVEAGVRLEVDRLCNFI